MSLQVFLAKLWYNKDMFTVLMLVVDGIMGFILLMGFLIALMVFLPIYLIYRFICLIGELIMVIGKGVIE